MRSVTPKGRAGHPGEYIDAYNYHRDGAKKPQGPYGSTESGAHTAGVRVRPFVAFLCPQANNPPAGRRRQEAETWHGLSSVESLPRNKLGN